ncbi:MAG: OFA family MFS transporter [Bacillota bacterium]|nr:OFA family MFS transporter [Bacillota bacterium]MDW7683348.1 OFA family MFS transporter [Bacillota bacterium]
MSAKMSEKKGWVVTFAGLGINLSLGVLYSWAMFADALQANAGWSTIQTQIPYMVACAVFAFLMVPGGRLQDKLGPKPVLLAAAALTLIGFFMSGLLMSVAGLSIFFGVVFGSAIGFGYAATTPPAIKWFGAHKRGLISGIVVSGFGIAGIYAAPLTGYLIGEYGLQGTFYILGIVFGAALLLFSRFIANPPAGYVPAQPDFRTRKAGKTACAGIDYDWREMLRTPQFYSLWLMFCFGTFAGLLIIGQLKRIGMEQAAMTGETAMLLVVIYAIFNFVGRIGCGVISDKFDRKMTLVGIFMVQVFCFAFFAQFTTPLTMFIGTAFVALTFGGMLSLFPSIACDYFGVKNMGLNYGLIFTAWGAGGVFGPLLGGITRDLTGTYTASFTVSAIISALGILLALLTRAPAEKKVVVPSTCICPSCGESINLQTGSAAG